MNLLLHAKAALVFPQLGVRFLADSNSWNVNGTPNLGTVRQMLNSTDPASIWQCSCTAWRTFFSWVKDQIFYFQVHGNLAEENMMYQHQRKLVEISRENVCRIKVFRANLGKLGKYPLHPQTIACSYTYEAVAAKWSPTWHSLLLYFAGHSRKINITFRKVLDYPLDLYYVMDLSNSMKDDLSTLQVIWRLALSLTHLRF